MASKLEKLNLTHDELDRFKKAFEDPKFRDLLREYQEEISDPKNRAEHEQYLREVEERAKVGPDAQNGDYSGIAGAASIPKGMKLVSPNPVFCLKLLIQPAAPRKVPLKTLPTVAEKIFINMCTCDAMDDISSQKVDDATDKKKKKKDQPPQAGEQFSLPYSLTGPRETKDTKGAVAKAYDFTFSESTWNQYRSHMRIVSMFQDMAIEAVEEHEGLERGAIHQGDVVILKNVTFKGGKPPPRLFKVSEEKLKEMKEKNAAKPPPEEKTNSPVNAASTTKPAAKSAAEVKSKTEPAPKADSRATPKHTLTHRGYYDMTEGQMEVSGEASARKDLLAGRPKELVAVIDLPEISSAADLQLDQNIDTLSLASSKYYLLLKLPYPVLPDLGKAGWSSKKKQLTVTMIVGPPSDAEKQRYDQQRAGFDELQAKKKQRVEQEEAAEKLREQQEQQEQRDRENERIAKERADAEAAAAAAESARLTRIAESEVKPSPLPPVSIKTPSPSNGPIQGVLKSPGLSPSTPSNGPLSEKKSVRFSFSESEQSRGIPERDGPAGPKKVAKILIEDVTPSSVSNPNKKGHKKKHIPGQEGPEAWTGVGKEPSKDLVVHFPQIPQQNQLSPTATSPSSNQGSKNKQSSSAYAWPSYTYSQSLVSVVLVIKIKHISADSVRMHMTDVEVEQPDGTTQTRSTVDLTFQTTSPKKNYRLFLPLAYAIHTSGDRKSSFTVTPANLQVNLMKVNAPVGEKQEWANLLDYSVLGEFDSEGTPLSSPSASPVVRPGGTGADMSELSLGLSQHEHDVQTAAANDARVEEEPIPVITMQPINVSASSILNPFVTAAATSAASTAGKALQPPSNSLLFQLD